MGFLTKLIPGGWILYAVIFAAGLSVGGLAAYKARGYADAPIIARAQTSQAQAEADAQRARTALADQQKVIALDAAAASEKALATQAVLQAQVADLTSKLAQTDKARRDASTKLLDSLKAIPHEQQATLSASVRAYLSGVRDQQSAGAHATPAADHHENGVPVPDRATVIP